MGVEAPEKFITFEEQVRLDHTSFIDGFIPATHVLIEQKGRNKDLRKPIKQSDGTLLTPFQQAQRYSAVLPYSQRPRWIITCNFEEFLVYDMEKPNGEPEQIFVKDLAKEYYRLMFLVDTGDDNIRREMEVSIQTGNLVGILYDEILKQYHDPENEESLKSLNTPVVATDDAVITDLFDPILSDISVTYNGGVWTEPTNYTYNEATGLFRTVAGNITVPAATFSQDPVTGAWIIEPSSVTVTVTGTV